MNKISVSKDAIEGRGFNYSIYGDRLKIQCPLPFSIFGNWFIRPSLSGKVLIYPHINLRLLKSINSVVQVEDCTDKYMYVESRGSEVELNADIRVLYLESVDSKINASSVRDLVATLRSSKFSLQKLELSQKIVMDLKSTYSVAENNAKEESATSIKS